MLSTPDDYTLTVSIPPQAIDALTEEELQDVQLKVKVVTIILMIVTRLFFHLLFSMLFDTIITVQILAYLPLTDIFMPANVHQIFKILISIVSFDYFSPTDHYDFGFMETSSWSPNFEWLGFESSNVIESLGSLSIFCFKYLGVLLIALGLGVCGKTCCGKYGRSIFGAEQAWSRSL